MEKKKKIICWVIIFLVAVGTRLFLWPNAISQVNCDEMMTAINAISISETGKDANGTSFPVYLEAWGSMGQSTMLMYLMAICIKIFGISIFSVRLPMLVISIIGIIVFYDLMKRIFKSEKIGLLSMAIVSICPWHMLQSIWSIDCNMMPHFLLFSMYFLYRGFTEKKWFLYISMIFFGLTMYTYGVSVYFVPIFLIIMAIYGIRKKQITIKELIISIVMYLLISWPIYVMYFINAFKIQQDIQIGLMTIQYFDMNSRTSDMLFFTKENIFYQAIVNIGCIISVIFGQFDGLEWNATPYFGTTYRFALIFFIIGLIYFFKTRKKENNVGIRMMQVWLIMSLLTGLFTNSANINRLNSIWYVMLMIIIVGINACYQKLKTKQGKKKFIYSVIGIYTVVFVLYNIVFFTHWNKRIDMSGCFSRGYIDAVEYIGDINKEELYYANPIHDGTLTTYVRYQQEIDNHEIQEITDEEEIKNRINSMTEKQAYIVYEKDLAQYDLENKQVKIFGEYAVITK